jgi:hypothetical protein
LHPSATIRLAVQRAQPTDAPWRRALPWVLGGAILLGLYLLDVGTCPTRRLFGLPCPGCGLTRATVALWSFDLPAAFALHPMVFVALPLLGWLALHTIVGDTRVPAPPTWIWLTAGALVVLVWAARLAGALGGHPDL